MSFTVTLLRHAESKCNGTHQLPRRGLGADLTDRGHTQAAAASHRHEVPSVIFSSPACRALETASAFTNAPVVLSELQELNIGSLAGRFSAEAWDKHTQVIQAWERGILEARFPKGESGIEVLMRASKALRTVERMTRGRTALAITHAGLMKFTIHALTGISVKHVENCGWVTLLSDSGQWVVVSTGDVEM